MTLPKISIVIVNWNGWKDTLQCLDSVFKSSYPDYRVIVVDNGSTNESVEKIEQWAQDQKGILFSSSPARDVSEPSVRLDPAGRPGKEQAAGAGASDLVLLYSQENLGFAGGNNIGIKHALGDEGDYVVLLNNDTTVPASFLKTLLDVASIDQEIGIVGCKVFQKDDTNQIQHGAQNRISWRGFCAKNLKDSSGIVEVNFVTGCIMFINSKVFRDVGLLNEKYFMYVEDVDFCYRTESNGWKIKVDLDTAIWHRHSASNRDNGFSVTYYSARNRLHLISRQLKGIERATAFVSFHVEQLLRVMRFALKGHFKMIAGIFIGNMDFLCGRDGPRRQEG